VDGGTVRAADGITIDIDCYARSGRSVELEGPIFPKTNGSGWIQHHHIAAECTRQVIGHRVGGRHWRGDRKHADHGKPS
jgi:hypothetical protein